MVYRKLRIVTIVLIVAIVSSAIGLALIRKFVFPPPPHRANLEFNLKVAQSDVISRVNR